jgi:predicted HTH domain antitoxin
MKPEIEVPETTLSALRQAPKEFAVGLCVMAAAKWYETGALSQERAAELAGQSRQQFLLTLSHFGVSPFQSVEEDMKVVGGAS